MVIAITDLDGPTLAVTVGLLEPIMVGGPPFKQCCRIDYSISNCVLCIVILAQLLLFCGHVCVICYCRQASDSDEVPAECNMSKPSPAQDRPKGTIKLHNS